MSLTGFFFFFQNGKKNKDKSSISIKMLLFLEILMTLVLTNVPPTSISSCLRQWGLPGLSVFILKTQKSVCGPWVIQNTKHSLKV